MVDMSQFMCQYAIEHLRAIFILVLGVPQQLGCECYRTTRQRHCVEGIGIDYLETEIAKSPPMQIFVFLLQSIGGTFELGSFAAGWVSRSDENAEPPTNYPGQQQHCYADRISNKEHKVRMSAPPLLIDQSDGKGPDPCD